MPRNQINLEWMLRGAVVCAVICVYMNAHSIQFDRKSSSIYATNRNEGDRDGANKRQTVQSTTNNTALVPVNIRLFAFFSLNARFYLIERQAHSLSALASSFFLLLSPCARNEYTTRATCAWQYVQFFVRSSSNMGGTNGKKSHTISNRICVPTVTRCWL